MQGRALVLVIAVLLGAGAVGRALDARRAPVAPLPCRDVAQLVTADVEEVVCLSDARLSACAGARTGHRYEACVDRGPMRGVLVRLHDLPLEVNCASEEDLRALPGVGPGLARRIREARDQAPFHDAGDLQRVAGIGPKRADQLAAALDFSPALCRTGAAQ